jgi:hypothetical protein
MIKNTNRYLKVGGVFAINIKQSKKWKIDVINIMCQFMTDLGLRRQDDIHMPISARPGVSVKEKGEQIYVFFKI